MLTFITGIFVGGTVGVVIMAILVASREDQYVPMRRGGCDCDNYTDET